MKSPNKESSTTKSSKGYGYGKRPMWHWILLYAVVGVIVYGAIYLFMMMNNSTAGSGY